MQWTLLRMFGVMTGIALAIIGTRTFGIAATVTSLTILSAALFAYSKLSTERRNGRTRIAVVCVTTLALYAGTFLSFRVFRTFEFSLAPADDPHHNIVVFSLAPAAQQFARNVYYPIITVVPGHCAYPTGEQMELLNRDPFTGERQVLYW